MKKNRTVTRTIPAFVARTQLGAVMRRANELGERFIVDKRGEPQVVILSVRDYLESVLKKPSGLSYLQKAAKKKGLDKLTSTEINREVRRIRKRLSLE